MIEQCIVCETDQDIIRRGGDYICYSCNLRHIAKIVVKRTPYENRGVKGETRAINTICDHMPVEFGDTDLLKEFLNPSVSGYETNREYEKALLIALDHVTEHCYQGKFKPLYEKIVFGREAERMSAITDLHEKLKAKGYSASRQAQQLGIAPTAYHSILYESRNNPDRKLRTAWTGRIAELRKLAGEA